MIEFKGCDKYSITQETEELEFVLLCSIGEKLELANDNFASAIAFSSVEKTALKSAISDRIQAIKIKLSKQKTS